MNNQNLLPDFGAIAKTDWGKPAVNTKDTLSLVAVIASAVMLITLFLPWFGISGGEGATKIGIATWTGIFALIGTLAALVGSLYNHKGLAFCGAALSALFALISLFCVFSLTSEGFTLEASKVRILIEEVKEYGGDVSIVRWGAIIHLIAAAATAVVTYLGINKK